MAANQRDNILERVPIFARNPDQIALDRRLHFLLRFFNCLHDFPAFLDRNALLQLDFLPDSSMRGGHNRPVNQILQGHLALHQLGLQNINDSLQFEFIGARNGQGQFFFVQLDVRLGILEIVAGLNLFLRLLHGVDNFRHLDLGDDIKTVIGHSYSFSAAITFPVSSLIIAGIAASSASVTAARIFSRSTLCSC